MTPRAVVLLATFITLTPVAVRAMCVYRTDQEHFDDADTVFEGVVLEGPESPARFRVKRYLKGSGPEEVAVGTGVGTFWIIAEGIAPHPGETWTIYGHGSVGGILGTSVCSGSHPGPFDSAQKLHDGGPLLADR